jgi:crotonobetainyl-CoA:carnitine CoA-transferase CaiB-like acyl-CoA transferase
LPPKVSFSGSKPRLAPACAAGEHSRAILAELGYDDDAVAALIAAGVSSDGGT